MLVLGLNTGGSKSEIALVSNEGVLDEMSWKAKQNESEKVLPELQNLLNKTGKTWKDINKIVVIQGPGPFTALRVSISIANALAYGLDIPVIGVPLIRYWEYRFNGEIVLYAGSKYVYFKDKLIEFDEFLSQIDDKKEYSGMLRPYQLAQITEKGIKWVDETDSSTIPTLGAFLAHLIKNDFAGYEESSQIKPLYFAPPNITKSKKAYK